MIGPNQSCQPTPGSRLALVPTPWLHSAFGANQSILEVLRMKTFTMLTSVLCTTLLAGCCTMHGNVKWEYQKTSDFSLVEKLGREGWTLDSWHAFGPQDGGTRYIMKRRLH